jgi:hypothetical protein
MLEIINIDFVQILIITEDVVDISLLFAFGGYNKLNPTLKVFLIIG